MDQKRLLSFLRQVMANNNREWFQEHKKEYEAVRAEFERGVQQAIERIVTFDPEIAHVQVKDCTYRFYRDTRFSPDKSPYKNHLGAYINAKSKKALLPTMVNWWIGGLSMLKTALYLLDKASLIPFRTLILRMPTNIRCH